MCSDKDMDLSAIHIYVNTAVREGDFYRWSARVLDQGEEKNLWFSFPGSLPVPDDGAAFLLAYLLVGMKKALPIHVHAKISPALLRNLDEFQAVFVQLFPGQYRYCKVLVDGYSDDVPRAEKNAISCFSGGADSAFTAYHHAPAGAAVYPHLQACFMVHGFDIPLVDSAYDLAFAKSRTALQDLGLDLYAVKTNIRELVSLCWDHNYGLAVAACMHLFKGAFSQGLIPSGFDYAAQQFAQGSNPITDHLLGEDAFRLLHDGARYSRNQKLDQIKHWPSGLDSLRVCWQGAVKSQNCCRCEKCTRTMINLAILGVDASAAFPLALTPASIKRLRLTKTATVIWRNLMRRPGFSHFPLSIRLSIYWVYAKSAFRHRFDVFRWLRLKTHELRKSVGLASK